MTQTPYTVNFPENTVCDILIGGGGGGGGDPHGGGGGAGQLIFIHQATLNGNYNIKVGTGGLGAIYQSREPGKGVNSEFGNVSNNVIAEGGGANTNTVLDKNGGSGAGGDAYASGPGGTNGAGTKNTTVDTFPGAIVYSKGNNSGVETFNPPKGGGGGGAGAVGDAGVYDGKGGDGLSGISDINYDFKTNFGTSFGKLEADNLIYFAGGGGGGFPTNINGSKGGGRSGGIGSINPNNNGISGPNNTESGGGAAGSGSTGNYGSGGKGGSGIVIIRYKYTKVAIATYIPNGYLKYNAVETKWELEEVHSLYQDLLENQAILAYENGKQYFNTYQYSCNGLQWFDLKRSQVLQVVVNSDVSAGSLSASYDSKVFIRLKYCSLNYVYSHHKNYIQPGYPYSPGSVYPYNQPFIQHDHRFHSFIRSHVENDMLGTLDTSLYEWNTRYYGGENVNFLNLDFEIGSFRDAMPNNQLHRMYKSIIKDPDNKESVKDYFFIKKINLATGEGGGVSGGGGGGIA